MEFGTCEAYIGSTYVTKFQKGYALVELAPGSVPVDVYTKI